MAFGPDFICIGMARAGTGWLFDQLEKHPDFWLPPVKELKYLKRPTILKIRRRAKRVSAKDEQFDEGTRGARNVAFMKAVQDLERSEVNLHDYGEMFSVKGDKLSGDITPGYSGLDEDMIGAVGREFPSTKIILMVRDPVSRAWSNINRRYRNGAFDAGIAADIESFRAYASDKKHISAAEAAERWTRVAPHLSFRHFFFDDLVGRSEWLRREIITYIGGDPDKSSGRLESDHNRKADEKKLELSDEGRAALAESLREELRRCAAVFGGHAVEWARRYGAL